MNRMHINTWLPLMLSFLVFSSCSRQYRVEGESSIISLDGKTLYLKMQEKDGWKLIDSAEVIHGYFKMKGPADTTRMVMLFMQNDALMPLVLESGKVKVSIKPGSLVAKGTPLNDKFYEFLDKRNKLTHDIEDLQRKEAQMVLDGADIDDIHDDLKRQADDKVKEINDYTRQFIADNYENVLGPNVFIMICSTLPYPMMTDEVKDIIRTAPAAFKENPQVKDFLSHAQENMKRLEENKRLQENMAITNH